MCTSVFCSCLSDANFVACSLLLSLSMSPGGREQEKSEKYLSFAMNIVTRLGRDDVPQVNTKGHGLGGHRTRQGHGAEYCCV